MGHCMVVVAASAQPVSQVGSDSNEVSRLELNAMVRMTVLPDLTVRELGPQVTVACSCNAAKGTVLGQL